MEKSIVGRMKDMLNRAGTIINHVNSNKKSKLMAKLMIAFAFPIILCIILGVVSYKQSSSILLKKYEESAKDSMESLSLYFRSSIDSVEAEANKVLQEDDIGQYTSAVTLKDLAKINTYSTKTKTRLVNMASGLDFISNYALWARGGSVISSYLKYDYDNIDYYEEFMKSDVGLRFAEKKSLLGIWIGKHDFIDQYFNESETANNYSISYIKKFVSGKGFLVLDISEEFTDSIIDKMSMGGGTIAAIITNDGVETYHTGYDKEPVNFMKTSFYEGAQTNGESKTSDQSVYGDYVKYQGSNYLFLTSKIEGTGITLCTLIPKEAITGEVETMRWTIIAIIVITSMLLLAIAFFVSGGISKEVNRFKKSLLEMAEGDLRVVFKTKRNDEFRVLTDSLNNMREKFGMLLSDTQNLGGKVTQSSIQVESKASDIHRALSEIKTDISYVDASIASQADNIQESVARLEEFSEQVNETVDEANEMSNRAFETIELTKQGKVLMNNLNEKMVATSDIMKTLSSDIKQVERCSKNIESIISTMNDISNQTNLLSLNASIEAARAGAAGRGFAVVAEEIRKLADESLQASKQIEKMIVDIQNTSTNTTKSVRLTEDNVIMQNEALQGTVKIFEDIYNSVNSLTKGLGVTVDNMGKIGNGKDEILDSMTNIMAAVQEVVASTNNVTDTVSTHIESTNQLLEESGVLLRISTDLKENMNKFIV